MFRQESKLFSIFHFKPISALVYCIPLAVAGGPSARSTVQHRSTRRRSEATLRCCSTASRYRDAAHCSSIRPTKLPRFHIHGVNVASCNSLGCLKAEIGENSKPIYQCFTSVRSFQWHHQVQALISEYKWIGFSAPISNHNRAMAMAFKALLTSFVPIPSRFPTDSFNFSVFSSSFRSNLAHWPIGSGRPCCIAQLTVPEAQGSRNNITHFIVPSFTNSARSAVWLPFPSRRTTWVASPGTATGRTPTPAKAYLQCVQPVGINQILIQAFAGVAL